MLRELKYFFYVFVVLGFVAFAAKYYFSDKNKKFSYRSIDLFDTKILNYSNNLVNLKSDTNNIIEYPENNLNTDKKKYKFWELFFDNEK